jgi:fatty-acyl-CoA synthase
MTANDSFLMIVPMFHANSWGLSFGVPMVGGKLVMTGPHMDGASVYKLMTEEKCTISGAVPTVWTGLLSYLDENNLKIPHLKETFIGGSAVPRSMIEKFDEDYDVQVIQAWGMTEMSPLGTMNRPLPFMRDMSFEDRMDVRVKQGRPACGVDMKIVDDEGKDLPHDGVAFGRLMVKGPWVVERYYKAEESALDADGWFDTGDIANIDQYGIMQITDRAKDVIKSGGEWISSVDIENTAVGHPELEIAACIGIAHEKWEERPLLVAVKKDSAEPSKQSILDLIASEHAKWQVPDDVVFIEEMPLTATGKIDKKPLRKMFGEHYSNT